METKINKDLFNWFPNIQGEIDIHQNIKTPGSSECNAKKVQTVFGFHS
jgi:hypothetical protein